MDVQANRKLLFAEARSGKYTQTHDRLAYTKIANCFCFLGLACEIYRRANPSVCYWEEDAFYHTDDDGNFHWSQGDLPIAVQEFFGFKSSDPFVGDGFTISELNDEHRYTLPEIADRVESYYLGL